MCAQSCSTLCGHMDCSPPGSPAHGIFQARILEWGAISNSRDLPDPGVEPASLVSPALAGGYFTINAARGAHRYQVLMITQENASLPSNRFC